MSPIEGPAEAHQVRSDRSRAVLAIGVTATALLFAFDLLALAQFGLSWAYLIPTMAVAWWAGRRPAIIVACGAAASWTAVEFVAPHPNDVVVLAWLSGDLSRLGPSTMVLLALNGLGRLGLYVGVALFVGSAGETRQHLTALVRERAFLATAVASGLREPLGTIAASAGALAVSTELPEAERAVFSDLYGRASHLESLAVRSAEETAGPEPKAAAPVMSLTARELEVLDLLSQGMDNRAIAEHLTLGYSTVRTHVQSILEKLDARSQLEAVVRAHQTGILDTLASKNAPVASSSGRGEAGRTSV